MEKQNRTLGSVDRGLAAAKCRGKLARRSAAGKAAATLAALALAGTAQAQDSSPEGGQQRPVQIDLRAGLQYDSNVAILDLDASSGQSDVATQLEFGVNYNGRPTSGLTLNAGYHLSQSLHQDFDAFDLRIHRGSAGFAYDLSGFNTGIAAHHVIAELDGTEFLTMRQYSPHLSRLFGTRLFMRFAHTWSDKTFRTNPDRDATAHALSADAYVFLNGLRTYLVTGVRFDDEDARAGHFDYRGERLRLQLVHRMDTGARQLTLRTQVRTERRNYREPTPAIEEVRRDRRHRLEVLLDIPFGERLVTRLGMTHSDNRSNLPTVDFTENVVSVQLRAQF